MGFSDFDIMSRCKKILEHLADVTDVAINNAKSVIDTVPFRVKNNTIRVDVYDKYGNFIETINTIKEVKEKYNVPASKIKNIE